MLIRIVRGKPVNAAIEINSDQVVHIEKMDRGVRLMLENGDMIALNGLEWKQYQEATAWTDEVENVVPVVHNHIDPVFIKPVRDARGQYGKGKIR